MIIFLFILIFLLILNQNNFPSLLHLFSVDEGRAITCHSHEIHQ